MSLVQLDVADEGWESHGSSPLQIECWTPKRIVLDSNRQLELSAGLAAEFLGLELAFAPTNGPVWQRRQGSPAAKDFCAGAFVARANDDGSSAALLA